MAATGKFTMKRGASPGHFSGCLTGARGAGLMQGAPFDCSLVPDGELTRQPAWRPRPGPADTARMTVADGIAQQLQDSGYAVIPGPMSQHVVTAAKAELGALLDD